MTLRDYLSKIRYKDFFNTMYRLFYSNLSKNEVVNIDVSTYTLIQESLKLQETDPLDKKIYITSSNSLVDVCFLNETEDEIIPFEEANLSNIIDMEILKALKIDDNFALAHIIYKIVNYEKR
jgi:hypothetical protein